MKTAVYVFQIPDEDALDDSICCLFSINGWKQAHWCAAGASPFVSWTVILFFSEAKVWPGLNKTHSDCPSNNHETLPQEENKGLVFAVIHIYPCTNGQEKIHFEKALIPGGGG